MPKTSESPRDRREREPDPIRSLADFIVPSGYFRVEPPDKKQKNTSPIWTHGVRVDPSSGTLALNKDAAGRFYCLVGDCKAVIKVFGKVSSNATQHLLHSHKIESEATAKRKIDTQQRGEEQAGAQKTRIDMDPSRYWSLATAKLFYTRTLPFSLVEDPSFRDIAHPEAPRMSAKRLKRIMLEMYIAVRQSLCSALQDAKRAAGGRACFHLNVDLWTSKVSGEKYMGLRLFYIDANFNYSSSLLAVTPFNPSSALRADEVRLSNILLKWVRGVLEEFHLSLSDLVSATTDGGSDIRRLGTQLLGCPWEWCIPHFLNCALVDAFGTSLDPAKSKNALARAVIVRAKKVVEHVNKSHPTQTLLRELQVAAAESVLKLLSDVPQRWLSTTNLLRRLLALWPTLRQLYAAQDQVFPIEGDHPLLLQLYSIMAPVADIIRQTQGGKVAFGHLALVKLNHLLHTTCDATTPLPILNPNQGTEPTNFLSQDELDPCAAKTRELLASAVRDRFFKRYSTAEWTMFDLCCFLYPPTLRLGYLDSTIQKEVVDGKSREERGIAVRAKVIALAQQAAEASSALPPSTKAPGAGSATLNVAATPAFQPQSHTKRQVVSEFQHFEAFSDESVTSPRGASNLGLTPEQRAEEEVKRYMDLRVRVEELPPTDILGWWRRNQAGFPLLSTVARRVFGFAVSAAGIERDFSSASNVLTRRRANLSQSMVEVSLFLNINQSWVPNLKSIPTLKESIALGTALPDRLKNAQYREVASLCGLQDDDEDDGTDDESAEWENMLEE